MNATTESKLKPLRANYNQVRGYPFKHFFCPILWKDENVELCEAHIVNQAFPNSAPDWTIQRKDVDNFYGSIFEEDFLAFQYHENHSPGKTVIDKRLSRRLQPKILLNDKPIDYFVAQNEIPNKYTRLDFEHNGQILPLGLKIPPEDVIASVNQNWEILISKDIRVAAIASLIKAAHLTLFEMVGYQYALSAGSHFIGREILGEFFYQNYGKKKSQIIRRGLEQSND